MKEISSDRNRKPISDASKELKKAKEE